MLLNLFVMNMYSVILFDCNVNRHTRKYDWEVISITCIYENVKYNHVQSLEISCISVSLKNICRELKLNIAVFLMGILIIIIQSYNLNLRINHFLYTNILLKVLLYCKKTTLFFKWIICVLFNFYNLPKNVY